jgi:hypothetical protein
MSVSQEFAYPKVIDGICQLDWRGQNTEAMVSVAWAYYYFSIQFRENLEIARKLYPEDIKLQQLEREECNTANLSPWPGVATDGEAMNHDEYMRRTLALLPIPSERAAHLTAIGRRHARTPERRPRGQHCQLRGRRTGSRVQGNSRLRAVGRRIAALV